MKQLLVLFFLCVGVMTASVSVVGAEVNYTEVANPYDVVLISQENSVSPYWLGELVGYPVLYEMVVDSTTTISLNLRQKASKEYTPFSLLVVRQDEQGGGVTEVARQSSGRDNWADVTSPDIPMPMLVGEWIQFTASPGTYRIEVSTPVNDGTYLLVVGSDPPPMSYFEKISVLREVRQHFGYSWLTMLITPPIAYPFLIPLLLILIFVTWKYRRRLFVRNE